MSSSDSARCCSDNHDCRWGVPVLAQTTGQKLPAVPQVAGVPAAAQQAAEHIDPERIRAAVKYLADDKLEGRGPGTEGDRMAAKYLSEQFASYGLTPAGDNGSGTRRCRLCGAHGAGQNDLSTGAEKRRAADIEVWCGVRDQQPDGRGGCGDRCADCVCGLRHPRAGIQLGRLQGRGCAGQGGAGDRERAAVGGSRILQGQRADILRAMDVQVSKRRRGRALLARSLFIARTWRAIRGRWCGARGQARRAIW